MRSLFIESNGLQKSVQILSRMAQECGGLYMVHAWNTPLVHMHHIFVGKEYPRKISEGYCWSSARIKDTNLPFIQQEIICVCC